MSLNASHHKKLVPSNDLLFTCLYSCCFVSCMKGLKLALCCKTLCCRMINGRALYFILWTGCYASSQLQPHNYGPATKINPQQTHTTKHTHTNSLRLWLFVCLVCTVAAIRCRQQKLLRWLLDMRDPQEEKRDSNKSFIRGGDGAL